MSNVWQAIKDKISISEYLDRKGFSYQRKGRTIVMCCIIPGHDDTKPSFTIFDDSRYTCFVCLGDPANRDKSQGDLFDLAALVEKKPKTEVLHILAQEAGLNVEDPVFQRQVEEMRRRFEETEKRKILANQFSVELSNQPTWLSYLVKKRGLSLNTIAHFQLGFDDNSQQCTIPLRDTIGRLVGFTIHHPRADPKYKNPTDTEVFHKSKFVFNGDSVKAALQEENVLFMVEGYFDAMSCYQAGYKATIGYLGSRFTPEQVKTIKGIINPETRIIIVPDGDKSGKRSVQAIHDELRRDLRNQIGVCLLAFKDDSDQVVIVKDANDWFAQHKCQTLPEPISYYEFIVSFILSQHKDEYIQAEKVREALKHANDFEKAKLIKRLADRWQIAEHSVSSFLSAQTQAGEVLLKDSTYRIEAYKAYVRDIDKVRMSTGLKEIDDLIRGINPGELFGIMGRANTFKTAMSTEMFDRMAAAARDVPTVMFSLEMPDVSITERMITQFLKVEEKDGKSPSRIVEDAVKTGDPDMMDWLEKVKVAHNKLVIVDRPALSVEDMDRILDLAESQFFHEPVRMIIVDHLQIVRTAGKSDYERTTLAARGLHELIRRRNLGGLILIQTSRKGGGGGDPISMDDARDSGVIEETMDFIVGIWRPELKALAEIEKVRSDPDIPKPMVKKDADGRILKDSDGHRVSESDLEAVTRSQREKSRQIGLMLKVYQDKRGELFMQILKSRREGRGALLVYKIRGLNLAFLRHGEQLAIDVNDSHSDANGSSLTGVGPDELGLDEPGKVALDG